MTIDDARSSDGHRRARLPDGRAAFIKSRRDAPAGFFAAESRGLEALRSTATLRVPEVFSVDEHSIVLEDVGDGRAGPRDWEDAGRALARLHRHAYDRFGFASDGFCGDSPQDNSADKDGHRFFAERRLLPQARRAFDAGLLTSADSRRVDSLCERLRELLPAARPALIHGDLWTGNLHACVSGELALIDAGAVHHGWAECDLAMLTLFGEPAPAFFVAYQDERGIDSDWRERAPVLNVYHLLNHLNLFGGSYLATVRSVLQRFA